MCYGAKRVRTNDFSFVRPRLKGGKKTKLLRNDEGKRKKKNGNYTKQIRKWNTKRETTRTMAIEIETAKRDSMRFILATVVASTPLRAVVDVLVGIGCYCTGDPITFASGTTWSKRFPFSVLNTATAIYIYTIYIHMYAYTCDVPHRDNKYSRGSCIDTDSPMNLWIRVFLSRMRYTDPNTIHRTKQNSSLPRNSPTVTLWIFPVFNVQYNLCWLLMFWTQFIMPQVFFYKNNVTMSVYCPTRHEYCYIYISSTILWLYMKLSKLWYISLGMLIETKRRYSMEKYCTWKIIGIIKLYTFVWSLIRSRYFQRGWYTTYTKLSCKMLCL